VKIHITPSSGDGDVALESLDDWLRAEPKLAGRVTVAGSEPKEGELGTLGDALIVAVGSGGTLSVLAMALKAWLSQPRRSDVRIRIEGGGRVIEIDANHIDGNRVDTLLRGTFGHEIQKQ